MNKIYALIDPRVNQIRYVGKAIDVGRRLRRHLKDARDGKHDHKSRWIASVLRDGLRPKVAILEECGDTWKERETWWINKLNVDGCDLTNCKSGGDGLNPTEESRRKMSEAKRGKPAHNKGKPASPEARAKQSAAAKARYARMTEDEKKEFAGRLDGKRKGRPAGWHHTEEARAKISEAGRGNSHTLGMKYTREQREQISARMMGHAVSEETKRKISETKKARRARRNKQGQSI